MHPLTNALLFPFTVHSLALPIKTRSYSNPILPNFEQRPIDVPSDNFRSGVKAPHYINFAFKIATHLGWSSPFIPFSKYKAKVGHVQ
jgi:hypothetical protein